MNANAKSRVKEKQGTVTERLVAAQCVIRRNADGSGDIRFRGEVLVSLDGEPVGTEDAGHVSATFAELGGRTYPVVINGNTVQVAGQTILDALESVYDYVRVLRSPPVEGSL